MGFLDLGHAETSQSVRILRYSNSTPDPKPTVLLAEANLK